MEDRGRRNPTGNPLNIDFTELVNLVRSFEKNQAGDVKELLANNEVSMIIAAEDLCEIINCFPPGDDRDELWKRILKAIGCVSVVSMLRFQIATKAVNQEIAHEAARTTGEKSRDITRETALLKRGKGGSKLSPAQLVPHVQEGRKAEKLRPLKPSSAETTVRRHLRGFSY